MERLSLGSGDRGTRKVPAAVSFDEVEAESGSEQRRVARALLASAVLVAAECEGTGLARHSCPRDDVCVSSRSGKPKRATGA
jgi:predicted transcriptional regulator